jgi:hypothetical protein
MLKSILNLIQEFVLKPAGISSGVLLILGIIFLFIINKNIKKSILFAFLGALISFIVFATFIILSIKLNEPKYLYLMYPFILNVWYVVFKKNKYKILLSNFFMLIAFFSDFYLVEKLLFE